MYNIELENWGINLPVNSHGQLKGTSLNLYPVPKKYKNPPYFVVEDDGSITFLAPPEGARTSNNTKYTRCELRELAHGGASMAAWAPHLNRSLEATLAVRTVSVGKDHKAGRIVIGQIHGPDDELCRLYYDKGRLYFHDDKSGLEEEEVQFDLVDSKGNLTNIPLGEYFDYTIRTSGGVLTVSAIYHDTIYLASESIGRFFKDKPCYFKAGLYNQTHSDGFGHGEVNFRKIVLG